ncbi:MAG: alginate lyase family protein [Syntrophotaleaceae bacterium]
MKLSHLLHYLGSTSHRTACRVVRCLRPKPRLPAKPTEVHVRPGVALKQPLTRCATGNGKNRFTFFNVTKSFKPARFDWKSAEMNHHWRCHLHSFDYLHDPGRSTADKVFLLNDWVVNILPGALDAWDPYPTAVRIVNWIKFFLSPGIAGSLKPGWLQSLSQQASWLERSLECHRTAVQRIRFGKALLFAGIYFQGSDAERWRRKGARNLLPALQKQVLPDGGPVDGSPMQQALVLEDCLDLLNLCLGQPELAELPVRMQAWSEDMLRFLAGMSHPDGKLALFDDSAAGAAPIWEDLADYFRRVTGMAAPCPAGDYWAYPDSGYYVMSPDSGNRVIIRGGPGGLGDRPKHAHNDLLSFELTLKWRRLIVDSGCCHFQDDEVCRHTRSNLGHNTLSIDDWGQSPHRRLRPVKVVLANSKGKLVFGGGHEGFRHFRGRPGYRRRLTWDGRKYLIEDSLTGRNVHQVESRMHVHPDFRLVPESGKRVIVFDQEAPFAEITCPEDSEIALERDWYCPELGVKRPCPVIVSRRKAAFPLRQRWIIRAL